MAARRGEPAGTDDDHEHVIDQEVLPVIVHSTPRYGRFLALGVAAGLVMAVILTVAAGSAADPGGPMSAGASGVLRVFGVYAAVCVAAGLLVMAVLALVLGSRSGRRGHPARAEHATTLVMDLDTPGSDDAPRWVGEADDVR